MLHVVSGRLRHASDGLGGREVLLDPESPGSVGPEALHRVDPDGPVSLFVDFHRKAG
ncbi:DUF1971 domain-containing protein [Sorangium sp. So ce131]|uniref:DUF1971 domain-containing protein n=1 Tax=Sorangium sp. So ce131 TaxID=3133282 RepID=UPI003F5E6E9E